MAPVMVNIERQLNWVEACKVLLLGVSVRVLLNEIKAGGSGLEEADHPQSGWAASNQVPLQLE